MKAFTCIVLVACLAVPELVKCAITGDHIGDPTAVPVLVEVPGYAKLVLGTYGKLCIISLQKQVNDQKNIKNSK